MLPDGLGHLLAAAQSCRHEGEGVAPVEGGARWAQRLSPGPARLEQHPVGQVAGVEADVRSPVVIESDHPSRQAHRAPAAPDAPDLGGEGVEAVGRVDPGEDPVDDPSLVPMRRSSMAPARDAVMSLAPRSSSARRTR